MLGWAHMGQYTRAMPMARVCFGNLLQLWYMFWFFRVGKSMSLRAVISIRKGVRGQLCAWWYCCVVHDWWRCLSAVHSMACGNSSIMNFHSASLGWRWLCWRSVVCKMCAYGMSQSDGHSGVSDFHLGWTAFTRNAHGSSDHEIAQPNTWYISR